MSSGYCHHADIFIVPFGDWEKPSSSGGGVNSPKEQRLKILLLKSKIFAQVYHYIFKKLMISSGKGILRKSMGTTNFVTFQAAGLRARMAQRIGTSIMAKVVMDERQVNKEKDYKG